MGGDEHVISLDRSAHEERRKRDDGEAKTADEVLIREGLDYVNT